MATQALAASLHGSFPQNLQGAPFLMPSNLSMVQNRLQQWLDKQHIRPNIVGEFDDSALMKAFGQAGAGVFIVPTAIAEEVAAQYQVVVVGHAPEVREQFYAISPERRLSNPAVVAITETARDWLK